MNSCGWGSGALFFAEMLPSSKIVAFSNSATQKAYIESVAEERKLGNITVITGNVVDFEFQEASFDRVISIEASISLRKRKSRTVLLTTRDILSYSSI